MSKATTRDITYIGVGVATIIAGGFMFYQLSAVFPMPGVKYVILAPYLSLVIYVLLRKVEYKYAMLLIGLVFGLIMTFINYVMGIAILTTTILSQFLALPFKASKHRAFVSATFFSGFTSLTALGFSKFLIGGIFADISWFWIGVTALSGLGFGFLGSYLGYRISRHMFALTDSYSKH